MLMVTEDGKCSIKILRSEEDPDTCLPGQPVSSTVGAAGQAQPNPDSANLVLHWRHVQQHMHDEVLSLASANNPRSQIERQSGTSTAALTTCHPARSHPRTRSRGASRAAPG